jgi:hypothetical protein
MAEALGRVAGTLPFMFRVMLVINLLGRLTSA